MKHLDENVIDKLADLCRIDAGKEEKLLLLKDLEKILNYVDLLQEVPTEGVPPCNSVHEELFNVFREDSVEPPLSRELFLANCPDHTGGLVKVPSVIRKNDNRG